MNYVYDEIAEEWNEYKREPLPLVNLLLPFARERNENTCLDAGTGNGRHLQLLAEKYHEVYAIDNSQNLLAIARKNNNLNNVHFDFADIALLTFENGAFDDVYCIAVLHHLQGENISAAFKEINRVMKSGGLFLGSVWNKHQAKFSTLQQADFVKWKMKNGKVVNRFVHFFEKEEIERIALASGFRIVELFYERKGETTIEKNGSQNLCFVLKKV